MVPAEVDLASLIDPKVLLGRGEFPWAFLAFPQSCVDQQGLPADAEAQEYIAAVQSLGVQVGAGHANQRYGIRVRWPLGHPEGSGRT